MSDSPDLPFDDDQDWSDVDDAETLRTAIERREEQIERLEERVYELEDRIDDDNHVTPSESSSEDHSDETNDDEPIIPAVIDPEAVSEPELVRELATIRDNMGRLSELRHTSENRQQTLKSSVDATTRQFDAILADLGVTLIDPDVGDDLHSGKHRVVDKVDHGKPGTVQEVRKKGILYTGDVLSRAHIVVSRET